MSRTEPRSERGQILIIFALSLIVIFGVAALAFDGGMMLLEKRTQQNAADAAALAGARFLPEGPGAALAAAIEIATANGYTDGVDEETVTVNIQAGSIEVVIDNKKPSFFAGVLGIISHDIGSRAVAANQVGVLGPFAMLSLSPFQCAAVDIDQGQLISYGDIQVNSACGDGLHVRDQGAIDSAGLACNVVGDIQDDPGQANCAHNEGVQAIPDPLIGLSDPTPTVTGAPPSFVYPAAPDQVAGVPAPIPSGCPGSIPPAGPPASQASPAICAYPAAPEYDATSWRLYPGYYPGGMSLEGGTFYLEPGTYHLGGGGMRVSGGSVTVRSVDPGGTTLGGGVLIFNAGAPAPAGPIDLAGGGSTVELWPLDQGTEWDKIVIFQARTVCETVTLNGAATLRGIIYAPCALVTATGSTGTVMTDHIIADTFSLTGGGGLTVAFDRDFLPPLTIAGLIE